MRPGERRLLNNATQKEAIAAQIEHGKARISSKVELLFRVVKCQLC